MSTIPLSKSYKPEKLEFPVLVSEKLDGVPVRFQVHVNDLGEIENYTLRTRQNKHMYSCRMIMKEWFELNRALFTGCAGVHTIVGELHQKDDPYAPFKDTNGIVRRQEDQGYTLSCGIFEYHWDRGEFRKYGYRMTFFCDTMITTENVWVIPYMKLKDQETLDYQFDIHSRYNPNSEGMVARSFNDTYVENKRSWGYQKMLNEPTIDLRIVSLEEAVEAKTGKGKGMVGRLVAEYKGTTIGIGPGKLTHAERKELWNTPFCARLAQIKYKAGGGYAALRQPTFQYWRDDKDTPDA